MDTRFWGPSGWKLLHHIAHAYRPTPEHRIQYAKFLDTLPYILPCKFCRASLTDYYQDVPYALANSLLSPTLDLPRWMWNIHNRVNDKLRKQGLHPDPNPTYPQVKRLYDTLLEAPWQQQLALFWDFLFSVAYHHPYERHLYAEPMPDCPPDVKRNATTLASCDKNKWNLLPRGERMAWFQRFWSALPAVLPPTIAVHWKRAQAHHPPTLQSRSSTLAWLWRMRCSLDTTYHDPYRYVCKALASYSSDCATRKGAKTCRATLRKTRKRGRT